MEFRIRNPSTFRSALTIRSIRSIDVKRFVSFAIFSLKHTRRNLANGIRTRRNSTSLLLQLRIELSFVPFTFPFIRAFVTLEFSFQTGNNAERNDTDEFPKMPQQRGRWPLSVPFKGYHGCLDPTGTIMDPIHCPRTFGVIWFYREMKSERKRGIYLADQNVPTARQFIVSRLISPPWFMTVVIIMIVHATSDLTPSHPAISSLS